MKYYNKIIKENWHKHAGYSAIIAIFWNLIFIENTYSPLTAGLEAAFLLAFVGVIWEGIHEMDSGAKLDWSKVVANFIGAFVFVYLYHWIF